MVDGTSSILKAGEKSSSRRPSLSALAFSSVTPSSSTTSCDGEMSALDAPNRGLGLLPYWSKYERTLSPTMVLDRSLSCRSPVTRWKRMSRASWRGRLGVTGADEEDGAAGLELRM